ncbi:MAG: hypothetical protein M5U12_14935 [Verrucomicrobia bacterium]|nr:hypothetical protein [Verrucomicrobiota bacterium]
MAPRRPRRHPHPLPGHPPTRPLHRLRRRPLFQDRPHRHKIALFRDLTPAVATRLQTAAPDAVTTVWTTFRQLCPTWWLLGEERQIHFGENFVDPPDFALDAFRVLRWLHPAPADELARRLDLPWCRADLYHVLKLAWWLEAESAPAPVAER